jgi:hypothetical protein
MRTLVGVTIGGGRWPDQVASCKPTDSGEISESRARLPAAYGFLRQFRTTRHAFRSGQRPRAVVLAPNCTAIVVCFLGIALKPPDRGRADAWSGQQRPLTRSSRARFLATVYYAGWHHVVEAEDQLDKLLAVVLSAVPPRPASTMTQRDRCCARENCAQMVRPGTQDASC